MPIRFHCEACEARVKVPGGSEGRKVKCPRCGHMQRVPHHAREAVAVPVGGVPEELHDADGTGSYEAQTEEQEHTSDRMERIEPVAATSASPAGAPELRTSTKNAPRKGGLDAGDSLAELADRFAERRDMTPSDVTARAMEKHEKQTQEQAQASVPASVHVQGTASASSPSATSGAIPGARPMTAPPKAVPLAGWSARTLPKRAVTAPAASSSSAAAASAPAPVRPATPFVALRNLAVALRITPALLIPATLWHVLNTTTVSGAIVTVISGGAIVALTWAIAEIADAVRAMAIAQTA